MRKSELRQMIREEVQRVLTEAGPSVETAQYVASHGREPRGTGNWAFQFRKTRNDRDGQMYWPTREGSGGPLPLKKALAMAKKEAKALGDIAFIYIMP